MESFQFITHASSYSFFAIQGVLNIPLPLPFSHGSRFFHVSVHLCYFFCCKPLVSQVLQFFLIPPCSSLQCRTFVGLITCPPSTNVGRNGLPNEPKGCLSALEAINVFVPLQMCGSRKHPYLPHECFILF